MTKATAGPGFLLQKGDGANPENYTTVAEVMDIKGLQVKVATHDVTNQSSPGGWAEYVPTVKEGGEITFKVNAIPTDPTHNGTTGLWADLNTKVLRNFRIQNQDTGATKWSCSAYVIDLKQDAPVNGVLTWDLTLKVSGQPTLA